MKVIFTENYPGDYDTSVYNLSVNAVRKLEKLGIVYEKDTSDKINPRYTKEINSLEELEKILKDLYGKLEFCGDDSHINFSVYNPDDLFYWDELQDMTSDEIEENYDSLLKTLLNNKAIFTCEGQIHPYYTIDKNELEDTSFDVVWDGKKVVDNFHKTTGNNSQLFCVLRGDELYHFFSSLEDDEYCCHELATLKYWDDRSLVPTVHSEIMNFADFYELMEIFDEIEPTKKDTLIWLDCMLCDLEENL